MRVMLLVLAVAALLMTPALPAQEARGMIFGNLTDPQGAAVPGVEVIVTNAGTNAAKKVVSNERGYWEAPLLDPGEYMVTAEATGFRRFVRRGIILNVNSRAQIDIALQLGNVTEAIEVTAQAPLLETSTASAGRVVDNRQVTELPYSDMNPYVLSAMAPGMQWTGAPDNNRTLWSGGGTSAFNTAGGVGENEYSIDGAPNNGYNRRVAFIPPSDAVGEFRLETANFDASFGRTSGATVNLTTKSGTNQYHGSIYDKHWQQRWNATPHFTRLLWEEDVRSGRKSADSPKQESGRSNSPGFTIGGPVRIPKVFNGRDKLFFFFNYSGIYQNLTEQPDRLAINVPQEAWRNGDFSDLLAIDPVQYQIYDPRTARLSGSKVVRDKFPGNKGIPVLNPMYNFYEKLYPMPNNPPGLVTAEGDNNYYASGMPKIDRHHSALNRIDWETSPRHKISGRWYWNSRKANTEDWTYSTDPGLHSSGTTRVNKAVGLDWVWTINPTNVLNVTGSYNRFIEYAGETGPYRYKPSDVGLPTYLDERAGDNAILPNVAFSNLEDVSYQALRPRRTSTAMGRAQLLRMQGNHSLKFGLDVRNYYQAYTGGGFTSGSFSFNNTYMRAASDTSTASNRGLEWAAFMMGFPTSISLDTNDSYYLTNPFTAFYVQDDIRISNRFHVNLGLRVEMEGGVRERYNRGLGGGFYPNDVLPISSLAEAGYAKNPIPQLAASNFHVLGGVRYLGQDAPRTISNGTKNLLPRFGAVYQLTPRMVIRAGYGWFFDNNSAANFTLNQFGYSQATNAVITNDSGLTFNTTLNDPFPVRSDGTRFDEPRQNSLGSMARAGTSWDYQDLDWKAQFQQRWRVSLQRELSTNMVVEIGYTGSYSKTNIQKQLNVLPEQYWATGMERNSAQDSLLNANVSNPFRITTNLAPLQTSDPALYSYLRNVSFFTSSNIRRNALLRTYPQHTTVRQNTNPDGRVKYSAIEAQLEKRFSKGFTFNVLYTYTNSEARDWYANEFDALPSWRDNSSSRPHRFVFTAIYELPFGQGRRFLKNGVASRLVGGWQISTVYQRQSGPPINWNNEFYYGDLEEIGDAFNHSNVFRNDIHQWFDSGMPFEKTSGKQPGTYHVRVFPSRVRDLRADGITNLDLRILRNFNIIGEGRLKAQFSVDALNAVNHTNFGAPVINPRDSNFGKVTNQNGNGRLIVVNLRFVF